MTTFSCTEMGSFKACRRQWAHQSLNGLGLTPWMPNKNLLLGTLIHAVLADWSVAWAEGDRSLAFPLDRFQKYWERAEADIKSHYLAKIYAIKAADADRDLTDEERDAVVAVANRLNPDFVPLMSGEEFATLYTEPVYDLGWGMLKNYIQFWGEPYPQTFNLVQTEQTITVPVPHTRHRLEGTFDMLLVDQKGRFIVPDHKTFERRPTEQDLQQNDQFLRYQWLAQKALRRASGAAAEVIGTMYNGLWKRPSPPRGRTFDELFYRELILHDEEEIEEIEHFLPHEVREMERVRRDPNLQFPNRAWSTCPGCSIQDLCLTLSRGEDASEFYKDFTHREKTPAWRVLEP